MSHDGAGSVYAVGLRVTRLLPSGAPAPGPNNMYCTDALVKIDFGLEYEDGEEVTRKNGAGRVCLNYKAPDTLKRLTIGGLEICSEDPELEELLSGGSIFTSGTGDQQQTVGYAAPEVGVDPMPNGVSIEAWSVAILDGAMAPTLPYYHWVLPRTYLRQSDRTLGADAYAPAFQGYGIQNSTWGDGPVGDWDYSSDRVYQWARVAALPEFQTGYQAVPAQV